MHIQDYVMQLAKHSGVEEDQVQVEVIENDDTIEVLLEVPTEDSGLFIGYHGDTLSSIQRLIRVIFQAQYQDKKILLNVNNYRQQRQEKITEMTTNIAYRVLETGHSYTFTYLTPQERFVVHTVIGEHPDFQTLESISEGEGRNRVLSIRLKQTSDV